MGTLQISLLVIKQNKKPAAYGVHRIQRHTEPSQVRGMEPQPPSCIVES
jgi:hypothetical protein